MRTLKNMIALAVFSLTAEASETIIDVPQGSGAFPTVGQVNCLEEIGSGRFCAATYECADDSGDLWGDMANHDGRRAIGADSPVARQRSCAITVDGRAAARWFTGFSPDGADGELVGVTVRHDATPPVIRRAPAGGSGGSGSFLSWYVERYEIDDVVSEVRDAVCGHLVEGTPQRDECLRRDFRSAMAKIGHAMALENTPFTRCAAEMLVDFAAAQEGWALSPLELLTLNHTCQETREGYSVAPVLCVTIPTLAAYRAAPSDWGDKFPDRYAECRTLLEEQWEREGFGTIADTTDGRD